MLVFVVQHAPPEAALGGGGYLLYDRVRRRKMNAVIEPTDPDTIIINNNLPAASITAAASRLLVAGDSFPLKRGSRGPRVTQLQQALSKSVPLEVDGEFGPKTAAALKAAGYSETVTESLFSQITGNLEVVFNPSTLAAGLYSAAESGSLNEVLGFLQQIKTVSDYTSVNEYYKKRRLIARTIVTDLLDYVFKNDETAKAELRKQFLRIGLKLSSSGKWSLQGLRLYKDLVTIRQTVVTDSKNNQIPVRRNVILGDEVEVANGMTWFRSIDNNVLKVPTQDVKYT